MRIATVQPVATASPPTAPEIFNLHLVSMAAGDGPGREQLTNVQLQFGEAAGAPYGGSRSTTSYHWGNSTGVTMRGYVNRPDERVAAAGVLDAIRASGLLAATLPPNDFTRPAAGRTRLYLDRRTRHVEFETGNPPAIVRPILDAIVAYELVARR